MNFQDFVNKGLLKEEKIGFDKIEILIVRALRIIKSAKTLFHDDEESAFQLSYEAMLLAGRSLVFSLGFRPRAIGSHKIVVDVTEKVLGKKYKTLVEKFDRMRKKRHYLIYGIGLTVSGTETKNAINSAGELVDKVKAYIEKKNPQKKFKF